MGFHPKRSSDKLVTKRKGETRWEAPNPEFPVGLGGDFCKADEEKQTNHRRKICPINAFLCTATASRVHGRCRAALGGAAVTLWVGSPKLSIPWSPTGKPGKAAERWSWGASEEVTDGEPSCGINIAGEPGFACAGASPRLGAGLRAAVHVWFGNGHGTKVERPGTPG